MGLSSWSSPGYNFSRELRQFGGMASKKERAEWERVRTELQSQQPFQFLEEEAMVSLLQSARIQSIQCSQKFCVFPDGLTCTPHEDVCRKVFSVESSVDPELVQGLLKSSWHMPGVERLCQDNKSIRVPPDISILSEDWESHYADDPFLAPHWETQCEDKLRQLKLHGQKRKKR